MDSIVNLGHHWKITLQALLTEGKAEILSRPSVLTLDNRQATIRVGEDIPIANSGIISNSNKLSFEFHYIPTGILLNVRPRISEDAKTVSMIIDATVSAEVLGEDLEIVDENGQLLATAPKISTRRVQTYAHIQNNMPFIIGGLIHKVNTLETTKVPILSKIPLLGRLFTGKEYSKIKREVIIVLTPYILPKKNASWPIPKAENMFDSFSNDLFRSTYRMRENDVFDLNFLHNNERLKKAQNIAEKIIRKDIRYSKKQPFSSFYHKKVPGEKILVFRMLYDVLKRLKIYKNINPDHFIFFESKDMGGYDVSFVDKLMENLVLNPQKAYKITFKHKKNISASIKETFKQPVPEVSLIDCPNRKIWGRKLWDHNIDISTNETQNTIILQNHKDIDRLRRALLLKLIVEKNGGENALSLEKISVGKQVLMPEVKGDQYFVIDADIARYFFYTEHYYPALTRKLENTISELEEVLKNEEIQQLLKKD
ncbi:MAG: type II and III secretion system protein [Verrucomicrobiota bacterium]|nr:type II and III secretion system protein [Verrucomicrobiota bacterium]